jgi:hypothetical protein
VRVRWVPSAVAVGSVPNCPKGEWIVRFLTRYALAEGSLAAGGAVLRGSARGGPHGRVVQVDPMIPVLKAPVSRLLKLICDGPP